MSLVTNIVIGIISAFLFLILLIIGLRFFRNRRMKNLGKRIEEQLDPKISLDHLMKKANLFAQEKKYVHAIIYLFYYFKKICEEFYQIKNATSIKFDEFPKKLAGYETISIFKLKKILDIYEIAYYNVDDLSYEDFIQVKKFVSNIPIDH